MIIGDITAGADRRWSGSFPLWQRTTDRRRITALSVGHDLPLPLMLLPVNMTTRKGNGHAGAYHAGYISAVVFNAERKGAYVVLAGVLIDGLLPSGEWYLAPDLSNTVVQTSGGGAEIAGDLVACTLIHRSNWVGQPPITLG